MSEITFIVWKDEFCVGSQILDAQHAGIINIINKLYNAMQHDLHSKQLNTILSDLIQYVDTHFFDEERIMRETDFPGLQSQLEAHSKYAQKVDGFKLQFQTTQGDLSFDVLNFLKNWWTNHILHMDRQYAPFITSEDDSRQEPNSAPG